MKTIFKNERGVPTLLLKPETDNEREQLKNVVCKSVAERLYLPRRLKVQILEGGGISVGKAAGITENALWDGWQFLRAPEKEQFSNTSSGNVIFQCNLRPTTIVVGNGTYRVYHNVDNYDFYINYHGDRYAIKGIYATAGRQVKRFTCRTIAELAEAMAWRDKK